MYDQTSNTTGHYRAFVVSKDNPHTWVHVNDSSVCFTQLSGKSEHCICTIQVTPVSMSTVLQQDPYMVLYELVEGNPLCLSLGTSSTVLGRIWLNDQV